MNTKITPWQNPPPQPTHCPGARLEIDLEGYQIRCGNIRQPLSKKEHEVLALFLGHPGATISRDELLDLAWGHDSQVGHGSVDNVVARLRAKLGLCNPELRWIETVRGEGYRWNGPPSNDARSVCAGDRDLIVSDCKAGEGA